MGDTPVREKGTEINQTNQMTQINLINHKTLTSALSLILASTLALTWVLSLREVRLKIRDYYYNQVKVELAANGYQKVVRQDRLRIDQGKANGSKNTECLGKLSSSFLRLLSKIKPDTQPLLLYKFNIFSLPIVESSFLNCNIASLTPKPPDQPDRPNRRNRPKKYRITVAWHQGFHSHLYTESALNVANVFNGSERNRPTK